jgi:arginine/lysine/ornithine decarboxylase
MALFGSTSPSYLILQSLDATNAYLANGYAEKLANFVTEVDAFKQDLIGRGFELIGNEPLKLTISTKQFGYRGCDFADRLYHNGIACEFADPDFVVLMLSCEQDVESLSRLCRVLEQLERCTPIVSAPPVSSLPSRVCTVREALFAARESIEATKAEGRVLASMNVSCPPAVPIAVCGERIDARAIELFTYYGIDRVDVVV